MNADAFVYTLEPSALLHSTVCHSSILRLPIGYPKGLEEGSVSLWGMPTLLEHVPLKTVTKHSLISLTAGSVSKIMLTDIRTLRTLGIQTLDCNVTQDSYSYYMLLCIVIHYSSNTYIFKQQQQQKRLCFTKCSGRQFLHWITVHTRFYCHFVGSRPLALRSRYTTKALLQILRDTCISGIHCENLQPLLWRWWGTITSAHSLKKPQKIQIQIQKFTYSKTPLVEMSFVLVFFFQVEMRTQVIFC